MYSFTPEDIQKNFPVAAISYVPPLSLLILLFRKDSLFARFHAKQGFILMLFTLVCWFIPYLYLSLLLEAILLLELMVGFVKAAQREAYLLPGMRYLIK